MEQDEAQELKYIASKGVRTENCEERKSMKGHMQATREMML